MNDDYIECDTWQHGMDGEAGGVRVMPSGDKPGHMALQIRSAGHVFTARLSAAQLTELHRQAVRAQAVQR